MDADRADGGGRHPEVEDEFACAGMLRGSLASLHGTVERIFTVTFGIGMDDLPHGNSGQIWLKLKGPSDNVKAAKLFVKGIVNQEEQREVSYPGVLHCVFCGARGLFMDCLIRSTSAHIVLGSPGSLFISGLTEPVVRAYSLIMDLVERYESSTQPGRSEAAVRGAVESPASDRAFKALVEQWEVRRAPDLQQLPASVKEILLDLVRESGPELDGNGRQREESRVEDLDPHWSVERMSPASGEDSADLQQRAEAAEERSPHSPQEVGEEEPPQQRETQEDDDQERHLSMGNKEFWLLLKFFTAMGYTEDVVKRVLARTGPKEASQILDLVQQEQDRSDQSLKAPGGEQGARIQPCETEHTEGREKAAGGDVVMSGDGEEAGGETGGGLEVEKEEGEEEDFVLGVIKKAAASCGYNEENVAKLYRLCPGQSTHHLLLELQREEAREVGTLSEGPRERDTSRESPRERDTFGQGSRERDTFREGSRERDTFREGPRETDTFKVAPRETDNFTEGPRERDTFGQGSRERDTFGQGSRERDTFREGPRERDTSMESPRERDTFREGPREMDIFMQGFREREVIREGPRETDDVMPEREGAKAGPAEKKEKRGSADEGWAEVNIADFNVFPWIQEPRQHSPKSQEPMVSMPEVKGPPMPTYPPSFNPQTLWPKPSNHSVDPAPQPAVFSWRDPSPSRAAQDRRGFPPAPTAVVTGEQRFLEGLQTPFTLLLADRPGDGSLRTVVIDGSNVAMSHGLSHFFSCRGIALAVQHFWDRGHRQISVLVPQWRQKSDPRIKEQHYLLELQQLGLLSYTPSREVLGKRISSYDDRFMLQLAQKTDGVIVTNDNLRDMLDESTKWRDIIKKRLLQYTFVGDHFMVPDDPLGKGGPHLDNFLRSEHRTPDPGNHSFAGVASSFPSSKAPRSQTEVLNFRDRTLGGAVGSLAGRGGGRAKGRGQGKRRDGGGHQHRQLFADRSPEETARLREQLGQVFPAQDHLVTLVLQLHAAETDVNLLSDLILQQQD